MLNQMRIEILELGERLQELKPAVTAAKKSTTRTTAVAAPSPVLAATQDRSLSDDRTDLFSRASRSVNRRLVQKKKTPKASVSDLKCFTTIKPIVLQPLKPAQIGPTVRECSYVQSYPENGAGRKLWSEYQPENGVAELGE